MTSSVMYPYLHWKSQVGTKTLVINWPCTWIRANFPSILIFILFLELNAALLFIRGCGVSIKVWITYMDWIPETCCWWGRQPKRRKMLLLLLKLNVQRNILTLNICGTRFVGSCHGRWRTVATVLICNKWLAVVGFVLYLECLNWANMRYYNSWEELLIIKLTSDIFIHPKRMKDSLHEQFSELHLKNCRVWLLFFFF